MGVLPAVEGLERVVIDRTMCTGRGVCTVLAGGAITVDEWGYPIRSEIVLGARQARELTRACPRDALFRREVTPGREARSADAPDR